MENDFLFFKDYIKKACERIDDHYFQLTVANTKNRIYRERVYCYELYHQLRCMLGENYPYKLYGEIDKSGHPNRFIGEGAKKPDFIFHEPGNMNRNLVIMEIKNINRRGILVEIKNDLRKIKTFINKAKYFKGIMLIYGSDNSDLTKEIVKTIKNHSCNKILVLWHKSPLTPPEEISL